MYEPKLNLPFFAYGIFRPGEISFLGIKDYVESVKKCSIPGSLIYLDGVSLLRRNAKKVVEGYEIRFKNEHREDAYRFIEGIEPKNLYEWGVIEEKNVLECSLRNISSCYDCDIDAKSMWEDVYFEMNQGRREGCILGVLREYVDELERLKGCKDREERKALQKLHNIPQLQMHYLLLWTLIERFTLFRYSVLGGDLQRSISERNTCLSKDALFRQAFNNYVKRQDQKVYSAREKRAFYLNGITEKLSESKSDNWLYEQSIKYYYQVRCNVTHRGKAIGDRDMGILEKSLCELLDIMEHVLRATKEKCDDIKKGYDGE